MSRQVQIRRGSATAHENFTGALGEITMDTTNKTLRVHDGETVGGIKLAKQSEIPEIPTIPDLSNADYVIESQVPTAENNYTWYRKYKSGWVEMGGNYKIIPARQDVSATISFPVQFTNNNYTSMCCPTSFEYSNNNTGFIFTQSKTTNSCIFHVFTNNSGSVCDGFDWSAFGY